MVKERVASGMYGSASEVVREALRQFFAPEPGEDDTLSEAQIAHIRSIVLPRLEDYKAGRVKTLSEEEFWAQVDRDVFGEDVQA